MDDLQPQSHYSNCGLWWAVGLTVGLMLLRMAGVIHWSAWLILAPFWAYCGLVLAFIAVVLFFNTFGWGKV